MEIKIINHIEGLDVEDTNIKQKLADLIKKGGTPPLQESVMMLRDVEVDGENKDIYGRIQYKDNKCIFQADMINTTLKVVKVKPKNISSI
jgi:hypothetical protein